MTLKGRVPLVLVSHLGHLLSSGEVATTPTAQISCLHVAPAHLCARPQAALGACPQTAGRDGSCCSWLFRQLRFQDVVPLRAALLPGPAQPVSAPQLPVLLPPSAVARVAGAACTVLTPRGVSLGWRGRACRLRALGILSFTERHPAVSLLVTLVRPSHRPASWWQRQGLAGWGRGEASVDRWGGTG